MSQLTHFVAAALFVVAMALITHVQAAYVVIVSAQNNISRISKADLKRVYLGKLKQVGSAHAVPTNLQLDSETAREFIRDVLGMTPQEFQEYWMEQQVKTGGSAPRLMRTDDNVTSFVGELPGGIGYVSSAPDGKMVKAVMVE